MPKAKTQYSAALPSTGIVDEADAARFLVAADQYVAENTSSREAAKAKLVELGLIDRDGKPTKPYR